MAWPPEIQEAEDIMNEAKEELLAYVESKEPRDHNKHHGLVAKMKAAIREFEKRVATLGRSSLHTRRVNFIGRDCKLSRSAAW